MENENNPQFLKRRKFLLALPILTFPFLTLMFWAMGGGKTAGANPEMAKKGFNRELPSPNLKEDKLDKMSYYDKANADSARKKLGSNIADLTEMEFGTGQQELPEGAVPGPGALHISDPYPTSSVQRNEEKVYQKLAQLNSSLNQMPQPGSSAIPGSARNGSSIPAQDIDRLEAMMKMMENKEVEDPEMKQLNQMLDKIMDIQNPSRVAQQLKDQSIKNKGMVYAVSSGKKIDQISTLEKKGIKETSKNDNGFYSFDNLPPVVDTQNEILAAVYETQTLVNNSTVRFRLLNDIYVNGVLIPKEHSVYGIASLSGDRLVVKISSIRYGQSKFPVDLSVNDLDGIEGINVPGAIGREVAKSSAESGIQNIGFNTLDPSVGMQAASVGIEAAKGFFSKKAKLIKVTVNSGYLVLLSDEKQK